ncbi:hypothetical protein [Nocardiopsis sp. JB363]|uniref:hypothetical protein n=1 Tax=Nocardiopsis sp. JB363 TaxID=1434837 RepID=UPI00097B31E4|nr:hypothetical protein [Nocardiopsis sp. JB363]SIO89848.1 putative unsaturated glucuronyl hydrolase [Nocardiopsis sp. JB363]
MGTERNDFTVSGDVCSPLWAGRALDGLLSGVTRSHAGLDGRFPLYRTVGQDWVSSRRGSWTGGMWTGLLWIRALRSGDPLHVSQARQVHEALEVWSCANTATRGLIFWYPLALSRLLPLQDRAHLENGAGLAARSLLGHFSPAHGVVPWGDAFGGPGNRVRVDGAPGVAPLMSHAPGSTPESARRGVEHLRGHLRRCWDGRTLVPDHGLDDSAPVSEAAPYWSRGRAWLVTAFADAVGLGVISPQDPFLTGLLSTRAPLVPCAEEAGGLAGDTGAAAIEAAALLRLADHLRTPGYAQDARERAYRIIRTLVEWCMAPDGGGLTGGSYDTRQGLVTGVESVWGDFFLALALAVIEGSVPADQC